MNFVQKLIVQYAEKLEADSKKLEKVLEWAADRRDTLDRIGPCIYGAGGEYMNVAHFEELEEILESDQRSKT